MFQWSKPKLTRLLRHHRQLRRLGLNSIAKTVEVGVGQIARDQMVETIAHANPQIIVIDVATTGDSNGKTTYLRVIGSRVGFEFSVTSADSYCSRYNKPTRPKKRTPKTPFSHTNRPRMWMFMHASTCNLGVAMLFAYILLWLVS